MGLSFPTPFLTLRFLCRLQSCRDIISCSPARIPCLGIGSRRATRTSTPRNQAIWKLSPASLPPRSRCGAVRKGARPPVEPQTRRGRRLRLRTCTSLCPSFLQGPRWAGTCCPPRQFVVVSIYHFQTGIASATAPPSHWPGGLRLGCGAAESQHCPITLTWLAWGRRFRQRRVGRRQLSIDRSRLWRQCSVSTLVVVEARGLRKVSLKPFPSHFKTEQTPRQPVRQLTTHSEQHSLSQSKTLPLSPTLPHPRTPTHPNPKSPSANHPPSPQTHIPLHSRVTTQPPSLTTTQPRHDSTAGYRPPGCPEETT